MASLLYTPVRPNQALELGISYENGGTSLGIHLKVNYSKTFCHSKEYQKCAARNIGDRTITAAGSLQLIDKRVIDMNLLNILRLGTLSI